MHPAHKVFMIGVLLMAPGDSAVRAAPADKFSNYYAAQTALKSGDCKTASGYLNAYLKKHSYVREKYPEHYEDIKVLIGQCSGKITVSGVEDTSLELDPLPDHPPMRQ